MISRRIWVIISVVVLAYAIILAWDLVPLVRGPVEWRWPRAAAAHWDQVWPLVIVLIAIALWVLWIDRHAQRALRPRRWLTLGVVALMPAIFVVQVLALRTERPNPLEVLFGRSLTKWQTAILRLASKLPT